MLARGEQVVRVAPKSMAGARRSARERGKSDVIDAVQIARAALREGIDTIPIAARGPRARRARLVRAEQTARVRVARDELRTR